MSISPTSRTRMRLMCRRRTTWPWFRWKSRRPDARRSPRDSMPCDTAIHLPDVRRSLSRLREELGSFPGYRLVLFGYEGGFTVNDAWLAAMIDGCDRINEYVHAYARPA